MIEDKFVMLFSFYLEMLVRGIIHLVCSAVYLNCTNVKLLDYCELGHEVLLYNMIMMLFLLNGHSEAIM